MIRSQDSWNLVSNYIQFFSESTIFAGWLFSNDWCASAHLLAGKCHTLHFHIDVHGVVPVVRVVPGMVHWPETWCLRSSWSQVLNPVGPRMNHVSILQNSTIALVLHSPRKNEMWYYLIWFVWSFTIFQVQTWCKSIRVPWPLRTPQAVAKARRRLVSAEAVSSFWVWIAVRWTTWTEWIVGCLV